MFSTHELPNDWVPKRDERIHQPLILLTPSAAQIRRPFVLAGSRLGPVNTAGL